MGRFPMALKSPEEIAASFLATLQGALAQTLQAIPRSYHVVLSTAVGGLGALLFAFGEQLRKDAFASSASSSATVVGGTTLVPLEEHGKRYGLRRDPGAVSEHLCSASAANSLVAVTAGTRLTSARGFTYETIGTSTNSSGSVYFSVRAIAGGVLDDGVGDDGVALYAELEWESMPPGITGNAIVDEVVTIGADAEDPEDFRVRVEEAQAKPRNYGDQRWYREECRLRYPGYEYWVYRAPLVPNGVAIYTTGGTYVTSGLSSALPSVAPPWDTVTVATSTTVALSVELGGLSLPAGVSLTTTRATIQTRVAEHLSDLRPWCTGLSLPPRKDSVTAGELLAIAAEVAREVGGSIGSSVLRKAGAQITEYRLGQGELAALSGSVSWT